MLLWLLPVEGLDALTRCGWDKLKTAQRLNIKAQTSSIWAKGVYVDDYVCVI